MFVEGHAEMGTCPLTFIEGHAEMGGYPLTFIEGHTTMEACPLTFAEGHAEMVGCPLTDAKGHGTIELCPPTFAGGHAEKWRMLNLDDNLLPIERPLDAENEERENECPKKGEVLVGTKPSRGVESKPW